MHERSLLFVGIDFKSAAAASLGRQTRTPPRLLTDGCSSRIDDDIIPSSQLKRPSLCQPDDKKKFHFPLLTSRD